VKPRHLLRVVALAALTTLFAGCGSLAPPPAGTPATDPPRQGRSHQLIVTLAATDPARDDALRRALAADHALREVGHFPLESIGVLCVVYEASDAPALAASLDRLARDARVESVQRNQSFGLLDAPDRGLRSLAYGAAAIGADRAQRIATGRGIRIAVVDTGVDRRHPDLQGRVTESANFVEHGEAGFDDDAHGTAVAGIVAARGGLGVAPEAALIALKACWHPAPGAQAVCSSWTLAKAVDHAIRSGAQVMNLSLAGPADPLLTRLLATAHRRGTTIVAAAADGAAGPGFPASLDHVLAVVASDARGLVAPRPWDARKTLLAAPGVEVVTTMPRQRHALQSGSSFAAAHVSGVAALLLQHAPGLTPEQVAQIVAASARPAAGATGIVDVCAALARVPGAPACH
jgi:subtilisin family serine protease